jgi:TRAP-type C4-dicarboxylate transport system permease small subunit
MAAAFVLATVFWIFRGSWRWFVDLIGLEEDFRRGNYTISVGVRLGISLFGGLLISFYLLLGSKSSAIPPELQFSIIPVAAVLGGLVIAGANYSKIELEQRAELLRVAQKLIVATISFIFFVMLFYFVNIGTDLQPNQLPTSSLDLVRLIFFYLATFIFFFGTTLFVLGIIDLALGLKNLKRITRPRP